MSQIILDIDPDNVFEAPIRFESEGQGPLRIEVAWPAPDHAHDHLVGFPSDESNGFFAGDLSQGLDLFLNRTGYTGHIEGKPPS